MNEETAIRVENLSKKFQIGALRQGRATPLSLLRELFLGPIRRIGRLARGQAYGATDMDEIMWALQDISFEVPRGQVLGIIGENGAGKSTLLKILTQIMEPSSGQATIKGRVGALLEVGTGFHPELTGRENTYLNGTILGMGSAEIDRKFDEIVSFAGVEKFIDTPIKHYSSGMKVRLGFAVAAHLEPEVLLIDEVLSVGDVAFQRKSLGKIDEVTRSGRTVLFVSHNMSSVEALCHRVIWLDGGRIKADGNPREVVRRYSIEPAGEVRASVDLSDHPGRISGYDPIMRCIRLLNSENREVDAVLLGEDARFELDFDAGEEGVQAVDLVLAIHNGWGAPICRFDFQAMGGMFPERLYGMNRLRLLWRNCRLAPGDYIVHPTLKTGKVRIDVIGYALRFQVLNADVYGTGQFINDGVAFIPEGKWQLQAIDDSRQSG